MVKEEQEKELYCTGAEAGFLRSGVNKFSKNIGTREVTTQILYNGPTILV
jgi:hypothetical protein